jgi:hypothetical protein
MSTDTFEDELRSLLHDTADAEGQAYVDVDPNAVVTQGRRVVRRRRLGAGAGIAASALVLAVGAWAVLDRSSGRDAVEPVPATRSSSVAPDVVSTTIAVEGNPRVAAYSVHLDRSTGRVTATDISPTGEKGLDVMIGRIGEGEQKAVWETLSRDPFIVVGVAPVSDQLMTRFVGDVGAATTSDAPLSTTAYEAFLVTTEKSPPEASLTGLVRATDGRIFGAEGVELPSATIPGDRIVYIDDAGREMGLVTPDGSAQVPLTPAAAGAPTGHLTTAVQEAGKPTVTTFALVLPIEAGDISVQVAPGATLVSEEERPLLGGSGVAVVATVSGPDELGPVVTEVTWTAEGRQVSWANPDRR